jgi:predicted nucleic acid-binding protein
VIVVEVLNVLRRLTLRGSITDQEAATGVAYAANWADVERHSVVPLLAPMWRLRGNVRGGDAVYVAPAARLDIPLVTTDVKLSGAPRLPCAVEAL